MTNDTDQLLRRQRARDNQAYAIADAIVNILRRLFFTLPLFFLVLATTHLPWTWVLTGSFVLSFPLQFWFRRWLEDGEGA